MKTETLLKVIECLQLAEKRIKSSKDYHDGDMQLRSSLFLCALNLKREIANAITDIDVEE